VVELKSPSGKVVGSEIRGEVPTEVEGLTRFMIFGVMSPVHIEEAGLYNLVIVINQDAVTRKEVPLKITTASARVVH
jgi:hypothetical protein